MPQIKLIYRYLLTGQIKKLEIPDFMVNNCDCVMCLIGRQLKEKENGSNNKKGRKAGR